jgi:hypothetical protein
LCCEFQIALLLLPAAAAATAGLPSDASLFGPLAIAVPGELQALVEVYTKSIINIYITSIKNMVNMVNNTVQPMTATMMNMCTHISHSRYLKIDLLLDLPLLPCSATCPVLLA